MAPRSASSADAARRPEDGAAFTGPADDRARSRRRPGHHPAAAPGSRTTAQARRGTPPDRSRSAPRQDLRAAPGLRKVRDQRRCHPRHSVAMSSTRATHGYPPPVSPPFAGLLLLRARAKDTCGPTLTFWTETPRAWPASASSCQLSERGPLDAGMTGAAGVERVPDIQRPVVSAPPALLAHRDESAVHSYAAHSGKSRVMRRAQRCASRGRGAEPTGDCRASAAQPAMASAASVRRLGQGGPRSPAGLGGPAAERLERVAEDGELAVEMLDARPEGHRLARSL